MAITTAYYSASGPTFDRCAFLAQRYDEEAGYTPHESECWICSAARQPDGSLRFTMHRGSTEWLTRLWRSPSGAVYVSSANGTVHMNRDPLDLAAPWSTPQLEPALFGVWGIDDRFVLAWGTEGQAPAMARWDGTHWSAMPAPPFGVRAVHGLAPNLVYAVGVDGGVARWDGGAWRTFVTPTREILASVFVASPDEIYAVGNRGSILEGSAAGWGKIGVGPGLPGPLAGVAKFKGDLWVGAGQFGLLKRVGTTGQFDCVKPNIHTTDFDVRETLLMAANEVLAGSPDGKDFKLGGRGWLLGMRASHPLCDF